MVHRSVEEDGVTRMEHQEDGVPIPAGASLAFAPGGYHLMLMQLDRRLEKGDSVPLTLRFERAGAIETELEVRGLTAGVE
jgi:copper(I)-binding protein